MMQAPSGDTSTQFHLGTSGKGLDCAPCSDDALNAKITELTKIVATLKESQGATSIGVLTLDILLGLVDEQIYSAVFEMHRAYKLRLLSPAETIPEKGE